jgi:hypothetical protein
MAHERNGDFEHCRDLASVFLADVSESELFRLEIDKKGAVESRKPSNIVHTKGNLESLDFVEALTIAIKYTLAHSPFELVLVVIDAGLFVVKALRKATAIKLDMADSAIICAMYDAGGKSIGVNDIAESWKRISGGIEATRNLVLSKALIANRLETLKSIGCVSDEGGKWSLVEKIKFKA